MTKDGTAGGVPTWRVNRAVRASDLEPPATLIMMVLSDIADNSTAEIPPQRTPSTKQLVAETRLGLSTVKRYRAALEEAGWIIVTRPTVAESRRGERLKYRLAIPAEGVHRAHEERIQEIAQTIQDPTGGVQSGLTPGFTVDPPLDSPWTPGGSTADQVGPERTQGGSTADPRWVHSGPHKEDVPDVPDFQKPPAGAGGREQRFAIAEELFAGFVRLHGDRYAQRHQAIRAVIITAVADNAMDRDDAAGALHRLALAGKQITGDSLTAALARLRADREAHAAPPSAPRRERRTCQVSAHSGVQLDAEGFCRACAIDAKAARDEDDDPPELGRIPTARRALHAVPDPETRSA